MRTFRIPIISTLINKALTKAKIITLIKWAQISGECYYLCTTLCFCDIIILQKNNTQMLLLVHDIQML